MCTNTRIHKTVGLKNLRLPVLRNLIHNVFYLSHKYRNMSMRLVKSHQKSNRNVVSKDLPLAVISASDDFRVPETKALSILHVP